MLHGGGAGGITAVDGVGIEAVRHFGRRMTETVRDGNGIHVVGEEQRGMAMPLRYNKDKRKNPVFSRVSAFVVAYSIPFPTLIASEKSVE